MNPANPSIDKASIIRRIPIFSGLPSAAQKLIEDYSYVAEYKRNHILYREGAPADSFYCMVTGRAKVFVRTPSGEERTLVHLHRGDYVGIISLLTNEPHSASVRIINDSLVLRIDKKNFDLLLKEAPQLALKFTEALSRRLKKAESKQRTIFESSIISVFGLAKKSGRTMYAVNLAIALAYETRKKVILLDMSHSGNECSSMLQMDELKCVDLKRHSMNYEEAKPLIVKYEAGGIYLLNMGCDDHSKIEPSHVISFLSSLTSEFNYIIVDMPAEIGKPTYALLEQSDLIHVVSDCNEHNLKATGMLIKELKKAVQDPENTVKAIINEFVRTESFEEEVKLLGHKAYATLPDLGLLAGMMSAGLPPVLAVPESLYSRSVRRIAREIGKILVGLALGSGAALGLAHIGVLKVLEREKIPVDFIAGTSIGAVVGAFWASGIESGELEKIALRFKRKDMLFSLADFSLMPLQGFMNGNNFKKFFREYLGKKTFHDTHIPLKIVANTLRSRENIVIDEGSLVDALRASCSIPAFIKPVRYGDDFLIDGGTLDPVPIDVLTKLGAKKIIAVNCLPSQEEMMKAFKEFEEKRRNDEIRLSRRTVFSRLAYNFRNWIRRTFAPNIFDVMMNVSLAMQYAFAEVSSKDADCVIHPVLPNAAWFELYKVEALIRRGEQETEKMLPQIKALIEE
ncbi:MAG: patatin-like phospholipase family protein [Candidatus Omnitrophica bacterium]|nr:patatin-like phospholipase family protein [Candidatus Omnitrophota bacterium]